MTLERSPEFRRAARRVLQWCAMYTRGLQGTVAGARQDEIASDLHEQAVWAAANDMSARQLERSVLRRMLLGVGADLAWRRQQQAAADPSFRFTMRANAALLALLMLTGVVLSAAGVFAIARVARALRIGDIGYTPDAIYPVAGLALLALASTMLLLARRTRVAGALLLTIPAAFSFQLVGSVLWRVSASTVVAFHYAPWWETTAWIAGIGVAASCAAAAGFWWSIDRRSGRSHRNGVAHV
jgi:hypothetical protein